MLLLETLTTAYSTVTCLVDDSDYIDTAFTTLTTTTTSSLGVSPRVNISIQAANSYVESLSVDQLAEFDKMLSQKENELDLGNGQIAIIPEIQTASSEKIYKKI